MIAERDFVSIDHTDEVVPIDGNPGERAGVPGMATFSHGRYPACSLHGAMVKMSHNRQVWRCTAAGCHIGCEWVAADKRAVEPREGTMGTRLRPDGQELVLYPMLFGNKRLCIGVPGSNYYDRAWCFHDTAAALEALASWDGDGDPPGYFKRAGA